MFLFYSTILSSTILQKVVRCRGEEIKRKDKILILTVDFLKFVYLSNLRECLKGGKRNFMTFLLFIFAFIYKCHIKILF